MAPIAQVVETPEGYILPPRLQGEDRRTDAEKRYAEKMEKREVENLRKMAQRSHRDRITQFNEHLGQLTEHYDIPKVGPG